MPVLSLRTRVLRCAVVAVSTLVTLSVLQPAGAQTLLIDFGGANVTTLGPSPDDPNNSWNNVTTAVGSSDVGVLPGLVTTENATTGIGLAMVRRFNGANENGTQASTVYPIDATRDSLYGNTEPFNSLSNIFPSFKLTGLAADSTYNFTFYASRAGVADVRETGYTVEGATTGFTTLNASANINGVSAPVTGIAPNAAGEITISLAPTPANNNGNHFTYLGVMKVEIVPPQAPLQFTLQPVSQRIVQFEPVTFSAAVQGPGPYSVQWYSNSVAIPGATRFTYTIPSTTIDMTGSQFSVSVSNLAFGVLSTNATLRVITDVTPPTITSVFTPDGQLFTVVFSELMDPFSAGDEFSYVVNDDVVQVTDATLQADGRTVLLTLETAISGAYQLKVNFVQDLSGNVIAAGTVIAGEVPRVERQALLFDFGGAATTDFGAPPDDPVNRWNNVGLSVAASDTGELNGLVTVNGLVTGYGLRMVRRFNGVNENGTTASSLFPADATRDSLYGNTEAFNSLTNIFPSFKLTGLRSDLSYKLTFFASRTGVTDIRETGYTVQGLNPGFAALNASANVTNTAVVSGILADAAGEITVSIAPTARNNNGNHFTYLGVLRVDPGDVVPVMLAPSVADGRVTVRWAGPGELESAPAITGPWTTVTPAPASPYSEALAPGENRFYRVRKN